GCCDPATQAVSLQLQPKENGDMDHFAQAIADRFGNGAISLPDSRQTLCLILDIRPHAAFSSARIPRAVSLSVPSTLLKPSLCHAASASARLRFSAWRSASRILVYDADSRDLAWLKGGFHAVWRERREFVDALPPTPDADDKGLQPTVLRTRHLPMAHLPCPLPPPSPAPLHPTTRFQPSNANSHPAFNPFFDTIRQNTELSNGITERIPLHLPRRVRRRIHELPFRWLQDIARRAANAPPVTKSFTDSSSSDLAMQFFKIELSEQRRLMGIMEHHSKESGRAADHAPHNAIPFPFSITAGVEKGAKNRYRHIWPFEHARVRLHQKKEADDDYVNASYIQPLGTNRRYIATQGPLPATFTDFWTLCWEQNVHVEGAMVKCGAYWTDTVFGPLQGLVPPNERPATASFFAQHTSLSAYSSRPPERRFPHSAGSQRRYRHHHHNNNKKRSETVKRIFELTHTGYPEAPPRQIVHLQYLEWPDLNVPDDPRGVLGLIKQVEEAVVESQANDPKRPKATSQVSVSEVDEKTGIAKHALGNSPVLLHCSAGVGRTGGFIAVDAILDAIRREIRIDREAATTKANDEAMDVDNATGDNAPRVTTVPLAISSGVGSSSKKDVAKSNSGLVVHVPVASPMQVDSQPDSPGSDAHAPSGFPSGTIEWAENVRHETGISGGAQSNDQRDQLPPPAAQELGIVSSNSPVSNSAMTTSSSNTGGGTLETHINGSYYYPSSSLGTSVSAASSSSKANLPSSNPSTLAAGLLHAVLNSQQSAADQRMRTASAPSVNVRSSSSDAMAFDGAAAARNPSLPLRLNAQEDNWIETNRSAKPPAISLSGMNPFALQSAFNMGGVSSDGEPPSRSQSPSADEGAGGTRAPPPPQLQHPMPVPARPIIPTVSDLSPEEQQMKALHPAPLTSFDEPIWEVVQDMREQRMSLCQSLRQYVFVHAAIIEGALMVIDEENEIADGLRPRQQPSPPERLESSSTHSAHSAVASPPSSNDGSFSLSHKEPFQSHSQSQSQSQSRSPSSSTTALHSNDAASRGASPTELLKKNMEGEVMLSKRPSIKRKQRSGDRLDHSVEDARYHRGPPIRVASGVVHAGVGAPSARAMPP
ncbi:hypothetical protein BDZ97DRAFT_1777127, partial [Flammula alnicola]